MELRQPEAVEPAVPGARLLPGRALGVLGRLVAVLHASELPSPPWPARVVHDLTQPVVATGGRMLSYLDHAADQIGTAATNDFVDGPLHTALANRLFAGLQARGFVTLPAPGGRCRRGGREAARGPQSGGA